MVGWCFFSAVPPGTTASALLAGSCVADAIGGGRLTQVATALVLMALVFSTNWAGLRASGRAQCVLAGLLVLLVLAAVAVSAPLADLANLEPFAPHGWTAIGPVAALLVWSFAGWEAIAHLAQEFGKPQRDLPRGRGVAAPVGGVRDGGGAGVGGFARAAGGVAGAPARAAGPGREPVGGGATSTGVGGFAAVRGTWRRGVGGHIAVP